MTTTTIFHADGTVETRPLTNAEEAQAKADEQLAVELAWDRMRERRNALLNGCDWTVLADTPTSTAAWKAYRQALRDLPANTTDPNDVVWPTPPS